MIRLGILGCGAITRVRHLVSALAHTDIHLSALVDTDIQRASDLRQQHGIKCQVAKSHREIIGNIDAAVNALPNHLHAPINLELLEAGIHVLSEKPLAITSAEARSCAEAAKKRGVTLAVGMPWRLRQSSQVLPLLLANNELGKVRNYTWEYGMPFDWPASSEYFLSREQAGGGVLLDEGVHVLDCVLSWFGTVAECDCQSDDWGGGVEANVILRLRHRRNHGEVDGRIRLSRTYALKNCLRVDGELASAEVLRGAPDSVRFIRKIGGQLTEAAVCLVKAQQSAHSDPFFAELDDFVQAIQGNRPPLVDGWQAAQTIDLIERCYAKAERIPEPWAMVELKGGSS